MSKAGVHDTLMAARNGAIAYALSGYPWAAAAAMAMSLYGSNRQHTAESRARRAYNDAQRDRMQMVRSGTAARSILFGTDRISGSLVYLGHSGDKSQFLHMVVALGAHEFAEIGTIYFNDIALPNPDADGWINGGAFFKAEHPELVTYTNTVPALSVSLPGTQSEIVSVTRSDQPPGTTGRKTTVVASSDWTATSATVTIASSLGAAYYTINYKAPGVGRALVRVKKYVGNQTAADATLITESGGEWTSEHVGYGVPYLYIRLEYDQDVFGAIGIPTVSAICRGAIVYDPRRNQCPVADLAGGTADALPPGVTLTGLPYGVNATLTSRFTDPATGLPFVELRFQGTAYGGGTARLEFGAIADCPAGAHGQAWAARVPAWVVSSAGVPLIYVRAAIYSGASDGTETFEGRSDSASTWPLASGPEQLLVTTSDLHVGAVRVGVRLLVSFDAGSVDVKLRAYLPQLWAGSASSAYDPWAQSPNAALCTAWWLRHPVVGGRQEWGAVSTAELCSAAAICDETVTVGSDVVQRRYTANGAMSTSDTLREIFDALLGAMSGYGAWAQGRWLLRAGAYESPELTIDESCLAQGDIDIVPTVSRHELFNGVTGKYFDASAGYIEREIPLVTNPVYVAADYGSVYTRSGAEYPLCRDGMRAQRLAKIELESIRTAGAVSLTCNLKAYRALAGRTVRLVLSRWGIDKTMLVTERVYVPATRRIKLRLIEVSASVYSWNYGNATLVAEAPLSSLPVVIGRPSAPSSLSVALVPESTGGVNSAEVRTYSVLVTWPATNDAQVLSGGRVLVQLKRDDASAWMDVGVLPGTATSTKVGPVDSSSHSLIRVAFVSPKGVSDFLVVTCEPAGSFSGTSVSLGGPYSVSMYDYHPASASITVGRDGFITIMGAGDRHAWYSDPPNSTPGDVFSCRLTQVSGSAISGAPLGAVLPIRSDIRWSLWSVAPSSTRSAAATLELLDGSGSVITSCSVTFSVVSSI
jgi:hypothetical protein